jgi:hypothetical protein
MASAFPRSCEPGRQTGHGHGFKESTPMIHNDSIMIHNIMIIRMIHI